AVVAAGHHAQRRCDRKLASRAQEGCFLRLGLALDQRERDVAAEQRAAFALQTLAEACCHGTDAGNRHHAERNAGDEDVKAAQAAAQFAQRVAQGKGRRAAAVNGFENGGHECPSIRPERSRTTRSQRCASELSCVTSTSVMPRSACLVKSMSTICLPVVSSRLPVGSSATRMAGSGASARACATACCSPPDNCVRSGGQRPPGPTC